MEEKIGMLIELLNEYDPYIASDGEHRDNLWGYAYQGHSAVFSKELAESYIISARYGFIKWLVENDKIDRDKELKENGLFRKYFYDLEYVKNYDRLVMWLSVEDEPINFLVYILK